MAAVVGLIAAGAASYLAFGPMAQAIRAGVTATSAGACIQPVPIGASPAARGYLQAANAATAGWIQVTLLIRRGHGIASVPAIELQEQVDSSFLHQLQAIRFTGAAVVPADRLETDLAAYLDDLRVEAADNGRETDAQWNAQQAVSDDRAQASADLRQTLALPGSDCMITRP